MSQINNEQTQPRVSVVIPAFNEAKSIGKVIEQMALQDYPEAIELIVVDNNSTDDTAKIAENLGAKVILEKNKGTRFAYDAGMRAARGEIICVTNADVRLPANWITSLVHPYADSKVTGVGTHIHFFD